MAGNLSAAAIQNAGLLIFNNTAWATVGDASGLQPSAGAGSLYLSLHTSAPTTSQSHNETAYTGYARVAVARTGAAWDVTSGVASNLDLKTFGACTASPGAAVTHVGIGMESAGATELLCSVALGTPITMAVGVIPTVQVGGITVTFS